MPDDWEFEYNGLTFGGDTKFGAVEVTGLNPPDARQEVHERAEDHGAYTFAGYYSPRFITIEGDILIDSQDDITAWRSAFKARVGDIAFRYKLPGEGIRRVYCIPVRNAFKHDREFSLNYAKTAIQLLAGDPRIYDDTESSTSQAPGVAGGADWPADFPLSSGGGTSGVVTLNNAGIVDTYPVVTIVGPATNPAIKSQTQGKQIRLEATLTVTDSVVIDFNPGKHTIYLNGTSRYDLLDDVQSEWWSLQPGDNVVQFIAGGTDANTSATLKWRSAWI